MLISCCILVLVFLYPVPQISFVVFAVRHRLLTFLVLTILLQWVSFIQSKPTSIMAEGHGITMFGLDRGRLALSGVVRGACGVGMESGTDRLRWHGVNVMNGWSWDASIVRWQVIAWRGGSSKLRRQGH